MVETGSGSFTLGLHPRLTIVAGAGTLEREGLINELIDGLATARSGVHLELQTDAGRQLAVFRPEADRHRVVDVDTAADVTANYADHEGTIDLLSVEGLSVPTARRSMLLTSSDLGAASREEELVAALAHIDQDRLWEVAEGFLESERELARAAERAGGTAADASLIEEIEHRHTEHARAQAEHERVRGAAFIVGAVAALVAVPVASLSGSALSVLPLLFIAVTCTAASFLYWRRLEAAKEAETEVLDETGNESYAAYQRARVKALVDTAQQHRSTAEIAQRHRAAAAQWELLAGDVPLAWALEHEARVRSTASRLRASHVSRNQMAVSLQPTEGAAAKLAPQLLSRLATLRQIGSTGESLPLLADDTFAGLPADAKAMLLESLVAASKEQQVIYLTDDEEVAVWARLEAMTGELLIVEPKTGANSRQPGRRVNA